VADGVDVTPGSGKTISTDERTIAAATEHVQRVAGLGGTGGASAQVTVTNTSTTIKSADDTRMAIIIINYQTVPIFIDPAGGTATTSNLRLDPGASITLYTTSAITGITTAAYTATGDAKVHYATITT
jgi:hypothetical protein